jgi:hypothetical protein
MPIIKIQNKLSGGCTGSSADSVSYLEKENRFRDKSMRKNESFFNQKGLNFSTEEVIKKLDSKSRGLGKNTEKYFSLTIAPSQKELKYLNDGNLKLYTKHLMELYAKNFNRNIDPDDLVWFAKLEHTRKYKGFKNGTSEKLPPGKKAGQFKPGDQRHIHILIRRKTELGKSLCPTVAARSTKSNLTGTQIGFDRTIFFHNCDKLMHIFLKNKNKEIKFNVNDYFISRYIKSRNGSIEKARKMGGDENIISQMEKMKLKKSVKETEPKQQTAPKVESNEASDQALNENQRILIAVNFHLENDYPDKIKNFGHRSGPLNAALQKKFGFTLSKEEINKAYKMKRRLEKGKGFSI